MNVKKFMIPLLLTATFALNSCGNDNDNKAVDLNNAPTRKMTTINYPHDQKFNFNGDTYYFNNPREGNLCISKDYYYNFNEGTLWDNGAKTAFGAMNPDHITEIYDIYNRISAKTGRPMIENPFAHKCKTAQDRVPASQ